MKSCWSERAHGYGYLHSLDLLSREWAPPAADRERVLYLEPVPGIGWPGLWRDLSRLRAAALRSSRHVLEDMGRVSDNPDNLYSRTVYGGVQDHVLISCGVADPHLALWNIKTHVATRFGKPGADVREITDDWICTDSQGTLDFYDSTTLRPLEQDLRDRLTPPQESVYPGTGRSLALSDGGVFTTRGQEFYVARPANPEPQLKPIPTPRPNTRILTLTADSRGKIWGASGFGQTIFSYDPRDGSEWNSQVVCDRGGEVYGMAFAGERLFLSAYSGGEHIVYDPNRAWDQIHNQNPQTLESVFPALIRPAAKSVIGPDGHFWTGWMAKYGVYGGGLSRVDVDTLEMTCWRDPVPEQAIVSLAADKHYLYFTTGGAGNGLPAKSEPFSFVVWDPSGEMVWRRRFDSGIVLGQVAVVGPRVVLQADTELLVFDPGAMRFERSIAVDGRCPCIVALADRDPTSSVDAAVFCDNALWRVSLSTGDRTHLSDLPEPVSSAVLVDGDLVFACGTGLYRYSTP